MKILIANFAADKTGGAEVYTSELILGLKSRKHDVTFLCNSASQQIVAACGVIECPKIGGFTSLGSWRIAPFLQWLAYERYIHKINLPKPDVIIASPLFMLRPLARRFPKTPRIYLPHALVAPIEVSDALNNDPLLKWTAFHTYYKLECWALLNSNTTVRFLNKNADILRKFYKLKDSVRFDIIPPATSYPDIDLNHKDKSTKRFLFIGRLIASKNVVFLINTLATMKDLPWELDIVGDGAQREFIENTINRLGLKERITLHGHQNDVSCFYRKADMFLFPSLLESVALVVLEAMAFGVPSLVIHDDGLKYKNSFDAFISNGENGLIAEDECDFATKLREYLISPDRIATLGSNARQLIRDNYTWKHALDLWDRLLENILVTA
ncbi:MAG: glycosyltransferase family 4 protein [Acidobacteriota bacterium]|jgi:glycosyltransferase involved in cell wall biosynthesis|nr:glycosyltransferase family 4 protein [Acidobacteriota bacterium]